jgi:predicted CoA-substrate-specific enzyme activase
MRTGGVDIGALWTKAVVLEDGQVLGFDVAPTGEDSARSAEESLGRALAAAGLCRADLAGVVATGAGKGRAAAIVDGQATEILCAARGSRLFRPEARGLVEMGAEATRVVKLDESGQVTDYALNDKCASGTGVFLDAMADALGVAVPDMGPLSLRSTADVAITNTCVVFAESEVVSQVHRQTPKQDILRGMHRAIASRIHGQVNRIGIEGDPLAIGGLALNVGILACLEELVGRRLDVPEHPQIVSAAGAALVAAEQIGGRA